jgi:hypothetical protein
LTWIVFQLQGEETDILWLKLNNLQKQL